MSVLVRITQRKVPLDAAHLRATLTLLRDAAGYASWDVGLRVASNRAVAELNRQYRGKRGVTDILSFSPHALPAPEDMAGVDPTLRDLGDMVIAAEYVRDVCRRDGLDERDHYDTLLAHGLVHLLGYDHETDEQHAVMAAREAGLLARLREARLAASEQRVGGGDLR
jgi:probable rRNA maturation factor